MLGRLLFNRGGSEGDKNKSSREIQPAPSQTRELRPPPLPLRWSKLTAEHPLPASPLLLSRPPNPNPDVFSPSSIPFFAMFERAGRLLQSASPYLSLPKPPVAVLSDDVALRGCFMFGTLNLAVVLGIAATIFISVIISTRYIISRNDEVQRNERSQLKEKVETIANYLEELKEWVSRGVHQEAGELNASEGARANDLSRFAQEVLEELGAIEEKHDRIQRVMCLLNGASFVLDTCFCGVIAWKAFVKPGFLRGIVGWVLKMLSLRRRG